MFQNITEKVEEQEKVNTNKFASITRELLKAPNIVICILAFLVSMLSIDDTIAPFGSAMVAATLSTGIPVFGVFISSMLGTLVGNGLSAFLNFILSSIIYFALVLKVKPRIATQERNELLKSGAVLFVACFIVSFFQNVKGVVLTYDFFMAIVAGLLTYSMYKIFVNGLTVIKDWKIKSAYTFEEVIGEVIIVAIASVVFNEITIFNLHASNIIIIFLTMWLGWKNGMMVGATAGLSMGLVISMIELQNGMQIVAFAVAGIIAGLFNRFGKLGVIIGFVLGNSLLIYLSNGDTIRVIYFREILVAAIGLLFVPNNININIEDLVEKNKLLGDAGENRLYQNEEVLNKLNIISETINDMVVDKSEIIKDVAEGFKDILFSNLEDIPNNIFYEDIIHEDNGISDDIFSLIQKNDIILESDLIKILKSHNSYIIVKDEVIKNDLREVIKIINRSYKMIQMEITKVNEKNKTVKTIKNSFESVSNAINKVINNYDDLSEPKFKNKEREVDALIKSKYSNLLTTKIRQVKNGKYIVSLIFENDDTKAKQYIANISNILTKSLGSRIAFAQDSRDSEYIQTYMSEDQYVLQIGSNKVTKEGSSVSGDCNLQTKLKDGKYLLAISDGMGTGKKARESSKLAITKLEELLINGFDDDDLVNFINSSINFSKNYDVYATLDFAVLDLFKGTIKTAKGGACNTYIKNKKNVNVIRSNTLPVGATEKGEIDSQTIELSDGDIIIMCSDGLMESQTGLTKDWVEEYVRNISTTNVQKIADLIVAEAIDNSFGIARDDITVIVAKVVKK